jgi:ribosomal protein S18 acetylase RimI-like enzyme
VLEGVGSPAASSAPSPSSAGASPAPTPRVGSFTADDLDGLALAPRTISPFDPADAMALLRVAVRVGGARVVGAVAGSMLVGVAVAAPSIADPSTESLLAVGVAPDVRGAGLGTALLRTLVAGRAPGMAMEARIGVAERDWVEPADVTVRLATARRLLAGAGFELRAPSPELRRDDPRTLVGTLAPRP